MSTSKLFAVIFGDGIERSQSQVLDKKFFKKFGNFQENILCAVVFVSQTAGFGRLLGGLDIS